MMLHEAASRDAPPAALHLVAEISHRVVNEFSEAIAMISVAAARAGKGEARDALERAAERLRAHAHSHRALLQPKTEEVLDLADHLERVCGALARAFIADNGARLLLRADKVRLPASTCWRIGLIVAELVRNAARHGLSGGAGLILVRIIADRGMVSCAVCDNGSATVKASPGLGQNLVRRLAAELGGTVQWRFTEHGGTAQAEFPDGEIAARHAAA
jgi:two-component sensor histidine kinase